MGESYKETMNLPRTDFPMRGNLPANEPKRLAKWQEMDLYHRVLEKNKNGKPFVLHDGPPYANGPIHIGHAFNKILKDFVIKSHAQRGFYTPYIPGWDCHGQPIEHMVEVTLGKEKMAEIDQPTIRRLCREWAEKHVDLQREGFKRLGVNGEWDKPYLTFTPEYEAGNVEIFKKMYLDGSIYRGRKPVHWCSHCHTALAEAEIEYGEEVSPSIFVRFRLDAMPGVFEAVGASGEAFILIWTTTPWTLPANAAVSLAPDADYVMVAVDGVYMILAHELVGSAAEAAGWSDFKLVCASDGTPVTLKGRELCGLTYTCPVRYDLSGVIVYGDHVSLDTGTGCVHTAPGHGMEDYLVGLEFDLPLLMPVDDNGILTDEAGLFAGFEVNEANPKIISWLREQGTLVASHEITHSYPHCWRCHKPVIFRATEQWFVSMEATGLRDKALDAIEHGVEWIPSWASRRIGAMVAERPDWCISRQRSWGVPIPVFRCKTCGEVVATEQSFDAVIELFRTEGADAWFIKQPSDYLPSSVKCTACGNSDLTAEKDILDVWWESGVSHTSVCKYRADEGVSFPADMYLEGSDQHRGWFQSALLTSVGSYGQPPYRSVMHCGFTMDENGEKMSKSKGNGVDPAEVMEKSGADVLRLWVASVDYAQDVRIGDVVLQRTSEAYRRIRNTFRFLLGSLDDFDPSRDTVTDWEALDPFDRHIMREIAQLLATVEAAYDAYRFNGVYRAIYDFMNELSAVYLDVTKDRIYSEAPASPRRRSAQTVMAHVLDVMVRILAPILSFTCDEVWECYPPHMRAQKDRPQSVQLAGWPKQSEFVPAIPHDRSEDDNAFACVLSARDVVTKALEEARTEKLITKSQEATLLIYAPHTLCEAASHFDVSVFEELFIVASVSFIPDDSRDEPSVEVSVTELPRCPRCWNHRTLGGNAQYPAVCKRCGDVLDKV